MRILASFILGLRPLKKYGLDQLHIRRVQDSQIGRSVRLYGKVSVSCLARPGLGCSLQFPDVGRVPNPRFNPEP